MDIAPALAKLIGAQADAGGLARRVALSLCLLTAKSSNPAQALKGRALVVRLPANACTRFWRRCSIGFVVARWRTCPHCKPRVNAELPPAAVISGARRQTLDCLA